MEHDYAITHLLVGHTLSYSLYCSVVQAFCICICELLQNKLTALYYVIIVIAPPSIFVDFNLLSVDSIICIYVMHQKI